MKAALALELQSNVERPVLHISNRETSIQLCYFRVNRLQAKSQMLDMESRQIHEGINSNHLWRLIPELHS